MIELIDAARWYGEVIALNGVSLKIEPGVVGLLGPNGAGKTTLLRMVCGMLRPTTGEVKILGEDAWRNPMVRRRVGYCPEHDHFYEDMTGWEFVTWMTRLHGFSNNDAKDRAKWALEQVMLPFKSGSARKPIKAYSKGMRQKVKLAQALAHEPDVLILDEPLTGTDPVSRSHISDLCQSLGARGKTVLISSHVLHEVERVTGEFALIQKGRLLAKGNVYEIRALIDTHPHTIELQCSDTRRLASALIARDCVSGVDVVDERRLLVETATPDDAYDAIPRLALELGIGLTKLESPDNNLEAVFRYLTRGY